VDLALVGFVLHKIGFGRRVRAELKRMEAQLIDAGLMPDCH